MTRFAARTAVVTGGGTGIGRATASLLAAEGATVVLAGRDAERGSAAVATIRAAGGSARFVATDVADDDQVAALAADAASDTGRIDLWFGNAGVEGPIGAIADWTDAAVAETLNVNVKGVLSAIRHASAYLLGGGLIINTASFVGALVPVPIAVPYAATKAAVVAAGQAAAGALGEHGISIVTVCPWIVDTPMVDRLTGGAGAEARAGFAAGFAPSGRLTEPGDVAGVVADLWGGAIAVVSGAAYLVDADAEVTMLEAPRVAATPVDSGSVR